MNNNAQIITADNVTIFTFDGNNINTVGKNVTILSINQLKSKSTKVMEALTENTIQNNNFKAKAENTIAIQINNSQLLRYTISGNTIKIESNNPQTPVQINNTKTVYVQKNTIVIKTNNKQTPVINTVNSTGQIQNNYIETLDITGENTIKHTGGNIRTKNNNPANGKKYQINIDIKIPENMTINSTYPVTINITNMMDEPLNDTITIKIDQNTTTQTLINGITTINFTTQTPGSHTITITYPAADKYQSTTETVKLDIQRYNTTITIKPVNTTIYENTNIMAEIIDQKGNKVTNGLVTFQINGTELKDEKGNIIYVDVTNGTAALNTYIPLEWVNYNTVTANYLGNGIYKSSNTTGIIKINRLEANMKVDILNSNIKPGQTAIIMVTVTNKNGNMIKSGKVIFKLNGKSIKDENGNTITVRIHNGIAVFKYTVPENYSAKNYTLTAVSVGNTYNKIQTSTTLALTRINTYIQNINTQFTGNTLHVQANIISATTQKNTQYRTTKVTVKINNKTFVKEVNVTNGTIDLNIDTSSIGRGNYKITIKTGDNGIYKGTILDTYTYKQPVKTNSNQTSIKQGIRI